MSFVNLHVHSALGSLLDSILTIEQIVKYAADNNQPAVAVSDHGTMHGFVNQVELCKKYGVKPIVACEIYEVDDYLEKQDTKEYKQPRYHLLLLARSQQGLKNLFKIVSEAATTGFYGKPRVSVSWINENNLGEGIICLTACQAGRVSRYLENGKIQETKEYVDLLKDAFDYVSLEIQSHPTQEQLACNTAIYNFAKENGLPYVITTDAHMLSADQVDTHSIFVEIGEGREAGETYVGCHLQTEKDVFNYLKDWNSKEVIQKGIDETVKIANMIDDDIDYGIGHGSITPVVDVPPEYSSHEDYLHYLVFKSFDEKFGWMSEEEQQIRRDRLERELPVINALDYTDYFIMLYMIAQDADKRELPRGYSRGSGANCLCLFMLGVTQIDSVRWDLDFSRFANMGRIGSLADFDWDISKRRRKEIIELTEELFGKENVAPIATFNTLSTKVAIKDIGKVLNEKESSPYFGQISYSMRDEVAKMIPTVKTLSDLGEEEEKEVLLKELVGKNEKLDKIYKQFPLWFKYVMELEGLPKSRGRHASATLITPHPVIEHMPLCLDNDKNVMAQLEMHAAMDSLGYCKMDYLGLENLDIIDDTLKLTNLTWKDVDINHLNLDDKKVFDEVYNSGNTIGIFQFESQEARTMSINAHVDNIEDVIAVNASNRPGTKDSFPDYCKNKLQPEGIKSIHPDLDELFKKTHSILLYQEDALHLFAYAGFPEEKQDTARRAIGKKKKDVMASLYAEFKDGLNKKQWTEQQIEDVWALISKQAEYSFNRGHAVAYSLLSYLTAWLKVYYPVEFMTALLTAKSDRTEKLSSIINDCHRLDVKVLPPQINESSDSFTAHPDKKEILFGFSAIKGIGASVISKIIENQPYSSFDDFLEKVQDKTATIALIKAGAFPTNSKMKLMQRYAKSLFTFKEYSPVKSLPTRSKLLIDWNLNVDDYKVNNKVDKEAVLLIYNQKKKAQFEEQQKEKYTKHMLDFKNDYAQDEFLWEFQSLSMFITDNPLQEAYDRIGIEWDDVPNGEKAIVPCVIVDIKRKKDRNNNPFAYIDLCINNQIVEATIWSRQLKEYSDLVAKGSCVCILGRKEDNHLFVEKLKTYQQWLQDTQHLRKPAT
jgi:DNA polymerase-3 subunit alpha